MRYVDCTPTWQALMPALLNVIENGETFEAKAAVREEMQRVAKAADLYNIIAKAYVEYRKSDDAPAFAEVLFGLFGDLVASDWSDSATYNADGICPRCGVAASDRERLLDHDDWATDYELDQRDETEEED